MSPKVYGFLRKVNPLRVAGPKVRPTGVTDGQQVNIPAPPGDVIRWGDTVG